MMNFVVKVSSFFQMTRNMMPMRFSIFSYRSLGSCRDGVSTLRESCNLAMDVLHNTKAGPTLLTCLLPVKTLVYCQRNTTLTVAMERSMWCCNWCPEKMSKPSHQKKINSQCQRRGSVPVWQVLVHKTSTWRATQPQPQDLPSHPSRGNPKREARAHWSEH